MTEDNEDVLAQSKRLLELFSPPVALSDENKKLLAELVRGAELCFTNAEQLFQEAALLREHKHFSRSIFLNQIAMEECAKVDMIGAAATALTLGHPVDLKALEKAIRDHKAKNFTNAYMSAASPAETSARKANDGKAASEAFENSQREIHVLLNTAKNASMYVDFKGDNFVAPDDVVGEEHALQMAALSYYFMSVTAPRLPPLRRMLQEPNLHSELLAGFGEAWTKALAAGATMEEMDSALHDYIKAMAAKIGAAEKSDPKEPRGTTT